MPSNEPKKSKYFRDGSDKPASKYIKQQGAQNKSKYLKTDTEQQSKYFKSEADREAERRKAQSRSGGHTSYHKNAGSTNLNNRTRINEQKTERPKGKLPEEVVSLDEARQSKGDHTAIFTKEKADKSAFVEYQRAEEAPDDNRRLTQIIRTGLIILALLIVSVLLNFIVLTQNDFKYLPSFLSVEFSAIPEFIAALAYGPIVGVIIALVKNVIHMLANQPSFISEMQNFILDSFYIFLGGLIYTRRMFNFKPNKRLQKRHGKDYRGRRIFLAGLAGTAATSIATFFTTRYLSFPLLIRLFSDKGYSDNALLGSYQQALDLINQDLPSKLSGIVTNIDNSFVKAILLFNVPLTFFKFLFITIVVALLYPPISDFLHYRRRSKTQRR